METMNKEDWKEQLFTFYSSVAPFIPDLMLTPQGLIIKCNKKDRLVFDTSFMPSETTITYNSLIDLDKELSMPFTPAYRDKYNTGVPFQLDANGHHPVSYHMHMDDNLFAAVGITGIRWAMCCSITSLIGVLGDNELELRSPQPDMGKFLKDEVSHEHHQLGLIINT